MVESNVTVVGGARAVTHESGGYFKLQHRVKTPSGSWTWRLVWRSDWETWGDLSESTRQLVLASGRDFPMGTGPDDPLPCLLPPSDSEDQLNRVRTERKTEYGTCDICGCSNLCGQKRHHTDHHPVRPSLFSFERNLYSKPITIVEPGAR